MRFLTFLVMLCLLSFTALAEDTGTALAKDIGCPKGTIRNGENEPGVTQAWCELATDRSQVHGPYRAWYGNGVLGTMENFNHGKRDGKAEYRWGNGRLQASGQYKNGAREGKWMFSDVSGSKSNHVLYKHGKLISGHEPKWVTERNAAAD
jgi:hypothetical protein